MRRMTLSQLPHRSSHFSHLLEPRPYATLASSPRQVTLLPVKDKRDERYPPGTNVEIINGKGGVDVYGHVVSEGVALVFV